MDKGNNEVVEVKLIDLVPFRACNSQTYHGERLEQLINSIERKGLMSPIIVRPIADEKYEIICGHNRVNAMRELGRDVIQAYVKNDLSDEEAMEFFYDSNLNQQSFSDWNYAQKIEAVKYIEKLIRDNSQQGKRTDLIDGNLKGGKAGTSVYSGQKLVGSTKKENTRDKMARCMGISTATLSKYRSIIKLDDRLIESIGKLLDQKRISFEVAYLISRVEHSKIESLIQYIDEDPNKEVDKNELKKFCTNNKKKKKPGVFTPVYPDYEIASVLVPKAGSGKFKPITNKH